jgi:hypothetical protein
MCLAAALGVTKFVTNQINELSHALLFGGRIFSCERPFLMSCERPRQVYA